MSLLRKYEGTSRAAPVAPSPGRRPSDLLDAVAEFFAPEAARMRAARDAQNREVRVLDDPEVKEIRRALLAIEDEHGTLHIAFVGKWLDYLLRQLSEYPAHEKSILEYRELQKLAREKCEREFPVVCPIERCRKRFRSDRGFRMHVAAMTRGRRAATSWGQIHAAAKR